MSERIALDIRLFCPRLNKIKQISFCKECSYYNGITTDKDYGYVVICDYVE